MKSELEERLDLIPLYQETEEEPVWDLLGGGKDDVFVYDRCGRLAFYIPYPLSMLNKPYVEAAILNTYYNHPCGLCNDTNEEMEITALNFNDNSAIDDDERNTSTQATSQTRRHRHHHRRHRHHHRHHRENRNDFQNEGIGDQQESNVELSLDQIVFERNLMDETNETESANHAVVPGESTRRRHRQPSTDSSTHYRNLCPDLNRHICHSWRGKFRLMKHCCQTDRDQPRARKCAFFTQSKCDKTLQLKKCCRQHHLRNKTADATLTPEDVNEDCQELTNVTCHMLAELGFTWSACCPFLSDQALKLRDQINFSEDTCLRFDDRLCYRVRFNKLEHKCCNQPEEDAENG